MDVGAGLYMYVVVVQKFTFAISSPDEFLWYQCYHQMQVFCITEEVNKQSEFRNDISTVGIAPPTPTQEVVIGLCALHISEFKGKHAPPNVLKLVRFQGQ